MKRILFNYVLPLAAALLFVLYFLNVGSFFTKDMVSISNKGVAWPLHFLVDSTIIYIFYYFFLRRGNIKHDSKVYIVFKFLILAAIFMALIIVMIKNPTNGLFFFKYRNALFILTMILSLLLSFVKLKEEGVHKQTTVLFSLLCYLFANILIGFVFIYLLNRETQTGWFWWCTLFSIFHLMGMVSLMIFSIGDDNPNSIIINVFALTLCVSILATILMLFVAKSIGHFFPWAYVVTNIFMAICSVIAPLVNEDTREEIHILIFVW